MSGVWHVNLCFWRSWQGCKEKTPGEGAEECFFTGTKNTEGQTKRKKGFWGKGGWWKSRGSLLFISLFNRSVVSDSLPPHKLQHARLPCRLLSPWVCTNSCPLSQWCHPTISSSVTPFSSCPQTCPASGSFPKCQLFTPGGQSTEASASVLPMNIQDWFSLGSIGLISLLSSRLLRIFSSTTIQKHQFLGTHPSLWSNSHICTWLLEKP